MGSGLVAVHVSCYKTVGQWGLGRLSGEESMEFWWKGDRIRLWGFLCCVSAGSGRSCLLGSVQRELVTARGFGPLVYKETNLPHCWGAEAKVNCGGGLFQGGSSFCFLWEVRGCNRRVNGDHEGWKLWRVYRPRYVVLEGKAQTNWIRNSTPILINSTPKSNSEKINIIKKKRGIEVSFKVPTNPISENKPK